MTGGKEKRLLLDMEAIVIIREAIRKAEEFHGWTKPDDKAIVVIDALAKEDLVIQRKRKKKARPMVEVNVDGDKMLIGDPRFPPSKQRWSRSRRRR